MGGPGGPMGGVPPPPAPQPGPQQPAAGPTPEGTIITQLLNNADPNQQKQIIGERIFPQVQVCTLLRHRRPTLTAWILCGCPPLCCASLMASALQNEAKGRAPVSAALENAPGDSSPRGCQSTVPTEEHGAMVQ
jgi:hypothetical protein